MYTYAYKVPGGKLLKVAVEVTDDHITNVRFTGDFFLHPEDALEMIEAKLEGIKVDLKAVQTVVEKTFEEEGVVAVGCQPRDFAQIIVQAVRGDRAPGT
ncbi:MAG: lipoate protein ligase C-terminal domain-containing protein [Candidatus Thorarchaeota archaeon]|nr:MAG: biotin--protein ligase [Candidatus Thorarchaeota archaeon]RLI59440.1 MAG: biotin--protein ligase [Candidatus Thorarchaeota archaeon]